MFANLPSIDPKQAETLFGQIVNTQHPDVFLIVAGAVLARVLGFMMVGPFFGSMNIPMTARVAFAVIMTAVITPFAQTVVGSTIAAELKGGGPLDYLMLLANQVLIGLFLGFCGSFIFYAIESAGRIIDTQRGSNMADLVSPGTGDRTSPTGQFLNIIALVIFVVSGLHMRMLEAFLDTFRVFPPTLGLEWLGDPLRASQDHPELTGVIKAFAVMSGDSLLLTLQIAAPAMMTLLLTDVLLGIINRGAPQVNVFALSQVVKGPIGIAALMIALLPIWNYVEDHALVRIVDGKHSITNVAQKMHDSDYSSNQMDRAEAAAAQSKGEVN